MLCLREREEAWCNQKEDYRKPWDKQAAKLSQKIQTQMRLKQNNTKQKNLNLQPFAQYSAM